MHFRLHSAYCLRSGGRNSILFASKKPSCVKEPPAFQQKLILGGYALGGDNYDLISDVTDYGYKYKERNRHHGTSINTNVVSQFHPRPSKSPSTQYFTDTSRNSTD
ncbi:hypothetical protein H102_05599 [Trichophyton rubrum CBS 100081]|nr:hypothetical protein H100_05632 [Trichophyton rubrum MR850]EZF40290.1 hypothetical protein H102_05599 [Trichophyton rubrum CBS 100081]